MERRQKKSSGINFKSYFQKALMSDWKHIEKPYANPSENEKIIAICLGNGLNFQRTIWHDQKLLFPTPFPAI